MRDLIITAVVVTVGALILGVVLRRRALRTDGLIGDLIKPPQQKFSGFDPHIRERTAQKRRTADEARKVAAVVETTPHVTTHSVLPMRRRG